MKRIYASMTYGLFIFLQVLCLPQIGLSTAGDASAQVAGLSVEGYELVSKTRSSRTEYTYTFRARCTNQSPVAAVGVMAHATSSAPGIVIIDDTLSFSDIPAGQSRQSSDTFTVKVDLRTPFDANKLQWAISSRPPDRIDQADLVDFSRTNIVTRSDSGFNDFSGNMGEINKGGISYGARSLVCADGNACVQRFAWDFGIDSDREAYTGLFFSLFGLTDTLTTFDGIMRETLSFPEHTLDLDKVDGTLAEPGGARAFSAVAVDLKNLGNQSVALRLELKDPQGGARFTRRTLAPGADLTLVWDFRDPAQYRIPAVRDLDIHHAKVLSLVLERENIADNVINPLTGTLDIRRIWFETTRTEAEPANDEDLLDLTERRSAQYFYDWSSRKLQSLGIPQDRSTFGDLLTMGGVGFALPAYIISAERGWLPRSEAAQLTRSVLKLMANEQSFGPAPKGRIGHKGWFYHFLGVDGRRRLNFDIPETNARENLNTVELSTIDTSLALMGALASQSYFSGNETIEVEIRTLAQSIYDRVEWSFMLEPTRQQFYLGWKPLEERAGPLFEIPDAAGEGKYSGVPGAPSTLDYYTDEALIAILLAAGSTTQPIDAAGAYCSLIRSPDANGLIRSYPGSLFTYQFLHAFLDTRNLAIGPCPGEGVIDWYGNSRKAILATIGAVEGNQSGFSTYGPNAWGLSAAEGPDDLYRAYAALQAAVATDAPQDGTVTNYGMVSSVAFGDDLSARVVQAIRNSWARGQWHYRFALPDAFNDEIAQAGLSPVGGNPLLRTSGPWLQRQLFAIDQGPMLLHLENHRSGLIWNLLSQNSNIQRGLANLRAPQQITLEAENGTGNAGVRMRSGASHKETIWLHAGESREMRFFQPLDGEYAVDVCYSNDNFGPLERVSVMIDAKPIGQFAAQDTGDFGFGWNNFVCSGSLGSVVIPRGEHTVTVAVTGGDGGGVEIDLVMFE